jgi:uncharacterized protein
MKDYLPLHVDPIRLAENAVDLRGKLFVKDLPRLVSSVAGSEGEADAVIHFDVDRQGIRYVAGHVHANVTLQCQRCLELFVYKVSSDFNCGIVSGEDAAKALPSQYEPVFMVDGNLLIHDMVEEELLINLPIVFMHDQKDCKIKLPIMVSEDNTTSSEAKKESPFKVIESLKVKPKQE